MQYKQTKDEFFSSITIPETPLEDSDGFQLVTNRKRRRKMLQTLAAQDNEPVPEDNDVFSDSDGKSCQINNGKTFFVPFLFTRCPYISKSYF